MTYDFKRQLAQGQQGEAYLDSVFAERYTITPATDAEQRRGIDRWFARREPPGERFAVEYKTDAVASKTNRAFIETVSVDSSDKRGWAYTSQANVLMYYVPGKLEIYIIEMQKLQQRVPGWAKQYPPKSAENRDYTTRGIVVPLSEIQALALATVLLWAAGRWVWNEK